MKRVKMMSKLVRMIEIGVTEEESLAMHVLILDFLIVTTTPELASQVHMYKPYYRECHTTVGLSARIQVAE